MSDTGIVGLDEGSVRLAGYSARWPSTYTREATALKEALGDWVEDIQHIGSTAVPGMDAKPIIDIALTAKKLSDLKRWIPVLEEKGYAYHGEYGLPGREFFTKGKPVKFHLHIVASGSDHWRRWTLFRDYLRGNERARQSYTGFKRMLAAEHPNNRNAYTGAKRPFIDRMMKDAESWLTW